MGERPKCLNCRERYPNRRGLCRRCYADPGIRDRYPQHPSGRRGTHGGERPVCWVCGKSGPYRYLLKNGWYVREIPLMSDKCREVYCPTCFAQWGWPDWKAHLATLGATA